MFFRYVQSKYTISFFTASWPGVCPGSCLETIPRWTMHCQAFPQNKDLVKRSPWLWRGPPYWHAFVDLFVPIFLHGFCICQRRFLSVMKCWLGDCEWTPKLYLYLYCWQLADKLWHVTMSGNWVTIGEHLFCVMNFVTEIYFVLRTLLQKCPRFSLIFRAVLRLPSPSQSVMKENPRKRPSVPPNSATCIGMYGQHCEQQHCPSKLIKVKVNQNLKHLKLKTLKQLWAAALSNVWTLMDNVHQGSNFFKIAYQRCKRVDQFLTFDQSCIRTGLDCIHVFLPFCFFHVFLLFCLYSCILLVFVYFAFAPALNVFMYFCCFVRLYNHHENKTSKQDL